MANTPSKEHIAKMRTAPRRPKVTIKSIASEDLPSDIKAPLRMYRKGAKLSTARQKRVLKALGITPKEYREWAGIKTFADFEKSNPLWSQRSWDVLMIENFGREIRSGS